MHTYHVPTLGLPKTLLMHKLTKSFFQEAIFILTCQGGNSAKVKIIEIPRLTQGLLVNIYKGESQFQIICKYMY